MPSSNSKMITPLFVTLQRLIIIALGVITLFLVLTGSQCTQTTESIRAIAEICNNGIDDDQDGLADCKDSDCKDQCNLSLIIYPVTSPTQVDSQSISGTQRNAQRVTVGVTPSNANGGTATLSAGQWSFLLKNLSPGTNQIVVTGADSLGGTTQVTTSIDYAPISK